MIRVAAFCLGICLLAIAGPVQAAVTIAVKAESTVSGPNLTLGDIAAITGGESERIKQLKNLSLGDAPPPGVTGILTPELLEPRLIATRADFTGVTWEVPKQFRITTASQFIGGIGIQAAAENYLRRMLEKEGLVAGADDLTLNRLDTAADMRVPTGKMELVPELYGAVRYHIPTTVMVSVRTDGKTFAKIPLRFEVRRFQNVAVAAVTLGSGDSVSNGSLKFERMDVGKLAAGYITDFAQYEGWLARNAIAPGTVLTENMIVKPTLIKRGDTVRIVARIGQMEVSAAGLALSQGGVGDRIRVQNIDTKKYLSGRVQADKSVLVMEDRGG
jgi:flagella basal body P-ring formation protein FlgA